MGRKYVLTGELRYDNIELSRKYNKAGYSQISRFEQYVSGLNSSRGAIRPDAVDLRWGQNREGLSLRVRCADRSRR